MKKMTFLFSFIIITIFMLSSNTFAWIEEGDKAPIFKMYQYKDLDFDLDTLIGEKIIVLVAGSYT